MVVAVLCHRTFFEGGVGMTADLATVRMLAPVRLAVPRLSKAYIALVSTSPMAPARMGSR